MVTANEVERYEDVSRQRQRDSEIFDMRLRGYTAKQIGDAYGITGDEVRAALKRMVVGMNPKYRADLVELENERLDAMMQVTMDQAMRGSLDHQEMVLKIMDRRAKLLGLDAPTKTTHILEAEKDTDEGKPTSSDRMLERIRKIRNQSNVIEGEIIDVAPAS